MTRIRTTGNAKPHIVHHGYRHTSAHSSRWADVRRDARRIGEPSLKFGAALLIGLFVVGVLLVVGFS